MPKYPVTDTEVSFSGRFNYNEFYDFFFNIFAANSYVITGESHSQKDKGGFDKVEVKWEFERLVDDYFIRENTRVFLSYPFHIGTVLAFLNLYLAEIQNLKAVLIGKVENVPANKIRENLTIL